MAKPSEQAFLSGAVLRYLDLEGRPVSVRYIRKPGLPLKVLAFIDHTGRRRNWMAAEHEALTLLLNADRQLKPDRS